MTARRKKLDAEKSTQVCANPVCNEMVPQRSVAWTAAGRTIFHSTYCWRFFPPKVRDAVKVLFDYDLVEGEDDLEGFVCALVDLSYAYPRKELPGILGIRPYTLNSILELYGLEFRKRNGVECLVRKVKNLENAFARCKRKWDRERRERRKSKSSRGVCEKS